MTMGRRRFTPVLDHLELRLPLSVPTEPIDAPTPPPGGNNPIIIAPVPPPNPTAPILA